MTTEISVMYGSEKVNILTEEHYYSPFSSFIDRFNHSE